MITEEEFAADALTTMRGMLQKFAIEESARGEQRTAAAAMNAAPHSDFLKRDFERKAAALEAACAETDRAIKLHHHYVYAALQPARSAPHA